MTKYIVERHYLFLQKILMIIGFESLADYSTVVESNSFTDNDI